MLPSNQAISNICRELHCDNNMYTMQIFRKKSIYNSKYNFFHELTFHKPISEGKIPSKNLLM